MKKLFFYAIIASFFTFAACQSDKNNQDGESVGNGINDEIGGSEGGINSDVQGEEAIGGEAIGTESDNTDIENLDNDMDMDNDTTGMQQQDQYQ